MKRILAIFLTILISLLCGFSIYSASLQSWGSPVATKKEVKPRYPVSKTVPETLEDYSKKPVADLRDPENINTTVEYDVKTGTYFISTKIGDSQIGTPINLTAEEYLKYQQEQSSAAFWKEKNKVDYSKLKKDFSLTDMQFDIGIGDKIFGEGGVRLKTQGSIETKFSIKNSKVDNPSLSENARNKTYFDFDQEIQMSVNGKVGDKIDVNMNYDTEATFDYDAKSIKLRYDGKEDEIIKTLEAGNVSMPVNSSLITGGSSLFGVKTELQFGKLSLAAVVSQQNSQTRSVSLKGGVQTKDFEIAIDSYDENRHYFLSHYFRNNYDSWMSKLPYISSGIVVTKVEVWITNKTGLLEKARNIVAFSDLAETQNIYNPHWMASGLNIPSNASNNLYSEITSTYSGARIFSNVNTTFAPLTNQGVLIGEDYERLESARRLEPNDYILNGSLGYISLKQALNSDEILAVAYEYTKGGQTYQVGEFSTDGIESPNTLFVKLLKGTNYSPEASTWDLMMKNIYTLNDAYNLKSENFKLNIVYSSDSIGTDMTYLNEGNIKNQLLLRVMGLDKLNSKQQTYPDGIFDYMEGYTVQTTYGRIIFPVLEPFGKNLRKAIGDETIADKYVFEELYDSTLTIAQQLTEKNKFLITGEFSSSSSGATLSLGAYNVPQGSVTVTAGGQKLTENVDYTVDYNSGTVTIINKDLITSGTAISASCEDRSTYSMVRKSMTGLSMNYKFSDDFSIGGTIMHMNETPLTTKVDMGYESVSNTLWGINTSYKTESQFITNLIDKLPLINATKPSTLLLNAEYARLDAGSSNKLNNVSYIDDFEAAKKTFNLKDMTQWFLASTPYDPAGGLFPEAVNSNDLRYGYNRSLLSWYIIDGIFNQNNSSQTPSHIRNDLDQLSNHFVRMINEKEIFPNRDRSYNQTGILPALNMAFYPKERGPYNYDVSGMQSDGTLSDPEKRWGGIMRKIESGYTNFESNNVEYIEFWLMDPYVYDTLGISQGGDLYLNLGEISEDVLKDGKRSFENGLPVNETENNLISSTAWGKVSARTSTAYAFDNTEGVRVRQDVGLDGISDEEEVDWDGISEYVTGVRNKLDIQTREKMENDPFSPLNDPAGDNYHYFRGSDFDSRKTGILDRYKRFNGTERNSLSTENTGETYSTAATTLPNVEDINLDFTLNETERYYQYKVSLRPEDFVVGKNYINDKRTSRVSLKNGDINEVNWYQFKIPVANYDKRIGTISGFNSIRFIRMFMTGFRDSVILRFATLELVRGDWRSYTKDLYPIGTAPETEATMDVSTVSLEENSGRTPINYKLPPGVKQETDPGQPGVFLEDEQSLSIKISNLSPGDARAVYKNTSYDFRQYERLQMFVHAEAVQDAINPPRDYEMTVFMRLGTDYQSNYYEYEIPLQISPFNDNTAVSIWPANNLFDIPFELLTNLKNKRNNSSGMSYNVEYSEYDPNKEQNKIKIKGNPTLSDVRTIMIGVRNKSGVVKFIEIWVNELRLYGFKEDGGWATLGSAVLNLSDLGAVTASGRYVSDGFGGLEQSVSQRRQDNYSQYNVALNLELGRLFPEKAKVTLPFYYSVSQEKSVPKFDPLNEDLLLEDVLNMTGSKAARDSILDYSQTLKTYRSLNFSNIKVNIRSKTPLPIDPANFSFNYNSTESYEQDPTTDYEVTKNYRGGMTYNYTSPFNAWEPFSKNKKMESPWLKAIKDFNWNFLPNTITASSNLTRYYYELQSRNLSNGAIAELTPLTVSKNFLWNTDLTLNWNITKSLKFNATVNNQAEVEETRSTPVNKELYATEYQNWKDTVNRSLREFGSPLDYTQTTNLTWQVPLAKIPVLDFMTLNTQYSSMYNWERSVTTNNETELGNQINNQRKLNLNFSANLTTLYNKSALLKLISKPDPVKVPKTNKAPTEQLGEAAAMKPQQKVSKKFEKELTLVSDSVFILKHSLANKRVFVVAVDSAGKRIPVKYKIKDDNSVSIESDLAIKSKITVFQKPSFEEESWYGVAKIAGRLLTGIKSFSFTYNETNGMAIPGFLPETGLFSKSEYGTAPGWDFALGLQGNDYLQRATENGWLIMADSITSPAHKTEVSELRLKASLEPLQNFKIELNAVRQWNYNTEIQYMFNGMPQTRTGSFTMTTVSLASAFENAKSSNGYYSKAFENFLNNRSIIKDRLDKRMENKKYPNTGFLQGSPLAGLAYDKNIAGFDMNSADVLIPAFLAAYSGKNANVFKTDIFPGLLSLLPNWSLTYDGLTRLGFIEKLFRNLTLNHAYTSTYSLTSFSSFNTYVEAGDGLGFVRDVLTGSPLPSSIFDISSVNITEAFNPLIRINGTLKNGLTLRAEVKKNRTLNLSISGGQIAEAAQDIYTAGTSYKLSDFHPWGFLTGSKIKNDLNVTGNLSFKNQHTLLRKIEGNYTQASLGNKTFSIDLLGDYVISKNMNLTIFYDYESSIPLVSSYPVTSSDFGFSLRFSLSR